jgi:hypothetical protein
MVAMMVTYIRKKKETEKQKRNLKRVGACLKHWGIFKQKTKEKMRSGTHDKCN